MRIFTFYLRVILPNLVFLSGYLTFFLNKDSFTTRPSEYTWAGYTFSVLSLIIISIYLNRHYATQINFSDKDAILLKLKNLLSRKGYQLQAEKTNKLVFNKIFVRSSFYTPPLQIDIQDNQLVLSGPKVKVDDVSEWLEELNYSGVTILGNAVT